MLQRSACRMNSKGVVADWGGFFWKPTQDIPEACTVKESAFAVSLRVVLYVSLCLKKFRSQPITPREEL